ncbi:methyl-accepting chemotaxis protein [Azonexus fungiphilus]|uniref:methyl-accepting chemotaxis protein n=1 Tax=Azonexus fungiphilus TaxID=146940 RepID=UPI00156B8E34|nr:methyl-accepting chemotaxis protein [Azonexus fungiphilus]NHC07821.1 methyl-accepting chemotaxis protein [Azonexus fungiphilus]
MALRFKLPKFGAAKQNVSPLTVTGDEPPSKAKTAAAGPGFLAGKTAVQQMKILAAIFFGLLLVIAILVARDNRDSSQATAYVAAAGEMRMLSQRLAKASSLALQGNPVAFAQLKESRTTFGDLMDKLTRGGELGSVSVPASPAAVQAQLDALSQRWVQTDKDAETVIGQEKNLIALGKNVATIDDNNAIMLELTEQVAALKLQAGATAREIAAANQLVMLTQRIAKNASALLVGAEINPEVAFLLGKDTNNFRDLMQGLARAGDADSRAKVEALEAAFKDYESAISGILGNMQPLVLSKQAGSRIFRDSEDLLKATDELARGYQEALSGRALFIVAMIVLIGAALGVLTMLVRVYRDDAERRTREVEKQRVASENANRENQDAILRLMNELGDLADGDLTVTATVSENITGAIADSINYTIEELRVLVGRINDAANRVTAATEIARQTSAELLQAAERQSSEIQEAGQSALAMARSMNEVSGNASQSAQVANQSLMAAEKGTLAVQDSIKGMNEIRNQIQETSKRIKRLGESSQEIGEIVELISDITEQTNVLALNAAIQAASAGDAGRGFTVVAEEVQRLAERSGEATKQIAAIVKTIQTDTQDAVSAMEQSTQGVVEGAKLSDAAGQALAEIGQVSRNLAELIQSISSSTQSQANSATHVARLMQDILRVTEQTTAGTQRTAEAVDELSALASELKGSVAGFKVD